MALQADVLWVPGANFSGPLGNATARSLSAATHWVGGQFIAPVSDTITQVRFSTGSVTSPVFDLEAAIVNLDASGFPLGSDLAVSSTVVSNPTATTDYSVTISYAVTAGTMYGIILRVKSGTYVSGSANVRQVLAQDFFGSLGTSVEYGTPCASYNIGSNTKSIGWSMLAVKYSSSGYVYTPGCTVYSGTASGSLSLGAASGNVAGNKFTLNHHVKLWGYLFGVDYDFGCNIETYSGSDNTAMTGSSVAVTAAYRRDTTASNVSVASLAAPILLAPGTYRVGARNTTASANSIRRLSGLAEAGIQAAMFPGGGSWMQTAYASGAWTDTDTAICAITPIFSAVDDGRPWAAYAAGLG